MIERVITKYNDMDKPCHFDETRCVIPRERVIRASFLHKMWLKPKKMRNTRNKFLFFTLVWVNGNLIQTR